jgi:mono/diheme cytochrome c family protein
MPAHSRSKFLLTRGPARRRRPAAQRYPTALALLCALALLAIAGCNAEPRKTDAELGLDPTQAIGRHVFDANCARCHEPYSSHGLHGPSLHNLYKKQYLPSGQPANDDRISEVIMRGRAKMPSFAGTLSDPQLDALLAYLKTL